MVTSLYMEMNGLTYVLVHASLWRCAVQHQVIDGIAFIQTTVQAGRSVLKLTLVRTINFLHGEAVMGNHSVLSEFRMEIY